MEKGEEADNHGNELILYKGVYFHPFVSPADLDNIKKFETRPDDIIIATYPKCVYVNRNPKDCLVSYYHYLEGMYEHTFDEFVDNFLAGKVGWGSFFDHVLGYWNHRNEENFLYVKYEDLKRDPVTWITKIAQHVGFHLTGEAIAGVVRFSSIDQMRASYKKVERELDHGFELTHGRPGRPYLRKGRVGDWRTHFSEDQNRRFDEIIEDKLKGTGLEFEFDTLSN